MVVERVRAWEQVNDPEYCGRLSMAEFHELALLAGYSAEVAQKAANQRGWDRLCAGVTV